MGRISPFPCCGGNAPVTVVPDINLKCWEWSYTMLDPGDLFEHIYLDGPLGTIDIDLSESLSDSEATIQANIEAGLNANSIPFTTVDVQKTDLGGGLFSIIVTIYYISYTNLVGQAGGNATFFIETTCTPPVLDIELRDDGNYELRDDGSLELRS